MYIVLQCYLSLSQCTHACIHVHHAHTHAPPPTHRQTDRRTNSKHTGELYNHYSLESLPVYSGNAMVRGDLTIFSAKRSFLLRKRIMEVSSNHLLLQMESNNFILSIIRFCIKYRNRQSRQLNLERLGVRVRNMHCQSSMGSYMHIPITFP